MTTDITIPRTDRLNDLAEAEYHLHHSRLLVDCEMDLNLYEWDDDTPEEIREVRAEENERRREKHLEGCVKCRKANRLWRTADPGDPRFMKWCSFIDDPPSARKYYRVLRRSAAPLPEFYTWLDGRDYDDVLQSEYAAMESEYAARERRVSIESGKEMLQDPITIVSYYEIPRAQALALVNFEVEVD